MAAKREIAELLQRQKQRQCERSADKLKHDTERLLCQTKRRTLTRKMCTDVYLQQPSIAKCTTYEGFLMGVPLLDGTTLSNTPRTVLKRTCDFPNTSHCMYKEQPKDAPARFYTFDPVGEDDEDDMVQLVYLCDAERLVLLRHNQTSPLYTTHAHGAALFDMLHKFCVYLRMRYNGSMNLVETHVCGSNPTQHVATLYVYNVKRRYMSAFAGWLPSYMMSYTKSVPDLQYNSPYIDAELKDMANNYNMVTGQVNRSGLKLPQNRFIYNKHSRMGPHVVSSQLSASAFGRDIRPQQQDKKGGSKRVDVDAQHGRDGPDVYKLSEWEHNTSECAQDTVTMKTLDDITNVLYAYHQMDCDAGRLHQRVVDDPNHILHLMSAEYMVEHSAPWTDIFVKLLNMTMCPEEEEEAEKEEEEVEEEEWEEMEEEEWEEEEEEEDSVPSSPCPARTHYNTMLERLDRWEHAHAEHAHTRSIVDAMSYLVRLSVAVLEGTFLVPRTSRPTDLQHMGSVGNIFVAVHNNEALARADACTMFVTHASFSPLTAVQPMSVLPPPRTDDTAHRRRQFQFAERAWQHDVHLYAQLDRVFGLSTEDAHLVTPYDIHMYNVMRQFYHKTAHTDSTARNKIFRQYDMAAYTDDAVSPGTQRHTVPLPWHPAVTRYESTSQTLLRDFMYGISNVRSSGFMHMNKFFQDVVVFALSCVGGPHERVPIRVVYGLPSLGKSNILSYVDNLFKGYEDGHIVNVLQRFSANAMSAQNLPQHGEVGDPSVGHPNFVHEAGSIRGESSIVPTHGRQRQQKKPSADGGCRQKRTERTGMPASTPPCAKKQRTMFDMLQPTKEKERGECRSANVPHRFEFRQKPHAAHSFDPGSVDGSSTLNIFKGGSFVDNLKLIYDDGSHTVVRSAQARSNDCSKYEQVKQKITNANGYVLVFNQHFDVLLDSSFHERVTTSNACAVKQESDGPEGTGETFSVPGGVDRPTLKLMQATLYNFVWMSKLKNLGLGPSAFNNGSKTATNHRLDWFEFDELACMVAASTALEDRPGDRYVYNRKVCIDTLATLQAVLVKGQIRSFYTKCGRYNELFRLHKEALMGCIITPEESRQLFALKQALLPEAISYSASLDRPHYIVHDVRVYALEQLMLDRVRHVIGTHHFYGDMTHACFDGVHENPLQFFGTLQRTDVMTSHMVVLTTRHEVTDFVTKGCWRRVNTRIAFDKDMPDFVQTTNAYASDATFCDFTDGGVRRKVRVCLASSGTLAEGTSTPPVQHQTKHTPYPPDEVVDLDAHLAGAVKNTPMSPAQLHWYAERHGVYRTLCDGPRPHSPAWTCNTVLSGDMAGAYGLHGLHDTYMFEVNLAHAAHINLVTRADETLGAFGDVLAGLPFRVVSTPKHRFQYACFRVADRGTLHGLRATLGVYEYLPLRPNGRPREVHPLCYPYRDDAVEATDADAQAVMFLGDYVCVYVHMPTFLYAMFNAHARLSWPSRPRHGDDGGYVFETKGTDVGGLLAALASDVHVDADKITPLSLFAHVRRPLHKASSWLRTTRCGDRCTYVPLSDETLDVRCVQDFGTVTPSGSGRGDGGSRSTVLRAIEGLVDNHYKVMDGSRLHMACINRFDYNNPVTCPQYMQTLLCYRQSNMFGWNARQETYMYYKHIFSYAPHVERERNARFSFIYLQNLLRACTYHTPRCPIAQRASTKTYYRVGCALVGTHANTSTDDPTRVEIAVLGKEVVQGLCNVANFAGDPYDSSGEDLFKSRMFDAPSSAPERASPGLCRYASVKKLELAVCVHKTGACSRNEDIAFEDTQHLVMPPAPDTHFLSSLPADKNKRSRIT